MKNAGAYFLIIFLSNLPLTAQHHDSPVKIFGYFQNNLQHQSETYRDTQSNSFSLQQFNLFFQTDIEKNWRAFVNFEFLNNFSSSRQWGEANIEEAWIRFGLNEKLNVKFGLIVKAFNNLNEIKNRTPLLPYVVRPIVYETSFREFISVDQFTPEKAFAQVYGFIPVNETKFDYAVYLGNSPNINNSTENGQTGIDTTDTFLVGGRLGLRLKECKIGISVSRDNDNQLEGLTLSLGEPRSRFSEVPRTRLGADIAFHHHGFSLEGEKIVYKLANESE